MRARLTLEAGEASPREWPLKGVETVKLGRQRDNTIVLRDKHASRKHAEVFHENGTWFLRDCGTTNGTRLNGERINTAVRLGDGSEIRIGDTCFRFSLESSDSPTEEVVVPGASPVVEAAVPVASPAA